MQYEVGQRIDIYKVMSNTPYKSNQFTIGTFRPAIGYNSKSCVEVLVNNKTKNYDKLALLIPRECRKVGTMIITKLK